MKPQTARTASGKRIARYRLVSPPAMRGTQEALPL